MRPRRLVTSGEAESNRLCACALLDRGSPELRAIAREGGLMLAIFQVPNKFFEADGRVIDAAGDDWDETWGHTRKG